MRFWRIDSPAIVTGLGGPLGRLALAPLRVGEAVGRTTHVQTDARLAYPEVRQPWSFGEGAVQSAV